jgi:methylated-DNA-[protein]-cysteine S-methyltransferase
MDAQIRSPDRYCLFDTAIGACGVAWSERGLTRLRLPEKDRAAIEQRLRTRSAIAADPPPEIAQTIAGIQRYLAGERIDFSGVAVDLARVDEFNRAVYNALRAVGWGETTTYGELARRAGVPGMAQAVGQAMAGNPMPVVIPCHRVLASGKRLGGFSAYGGVATKERLLALEGIVSPLLPGLDEPDAANLR